MSLESNIGAPMEKVSIHAIIPPGQAPARECPEFPPAPVEQVRAIETVFAQDQESQSAAGLLGLWAGSVLLHDLLTDHLNRPEEEEEPARRTTDPRLRDEEDAE
jgi:hypothetical protein